MKANARQYAESLTAAFDASGKTPQQLVTGLMSLLSKKRVSKKNIHKILAALVKDEQEKRGVVSVEIETATAPEALTKKKLLAQAEALFPGKNIEGTFILNTALKAGFRIRGNGRELDQSLKTGLRKLSQHLTRI